MIKVTVRLISICKNGKFSSKEFDFEDDSTIETIVTKLDLKTEEKSCRILINGKFADFDSSVKDGDTVSILPIIGGG